MNRLMQALADDMAAIFSDNAMPADPWDDGSLPMIAKPHGLEATEYRDTAVQFSNTDIEVSESVYYPQERK